MNNVLKISLFSLVFSQSLLAATLEDYKTKWNQRRPLDEQYDVLKKMNADGLLAATLKGQFEKAEETCKLPKSKEEELILFKNAPKPCADALKAAYKEVFKQLIMNK